MSDRHNPGPPPSVTRQTTGMLGVLGFSLSLYFLSKAGFDRVNATVIAMIGTALPMLLHELVFLKAHRQPSAGLQGFTLRGHEPANWERICIKLLGLWGTLGLIAFAYWLFPEYARDLYLPFWTFCRDYALAFVFLSTVYFWLIDKWQKEPEDEYFVVGQMFIGKRNTASGEEIRRHFLNWIIKGFFLPLMFVYFASSVQFLINEPIGNAFNNFRMFVRYVSKFAVGLDLAIATIGYILTIRLANAHIRTPNNLFWGWTVTLCVYAPFYGLIGKRYLDHTDGNGWLEMFAENTGIWFYIWGVAIIISKVGWVWANVTFGIRFSNLTNRGILTNGPFRWFRHPSYFFKNTSWWLLTVPFFSTESNEVALQNICLMLCLNTVYLLRAKAEEKHLSEDPTYVEYALWVEKHGALRGLRAVFPFLRYKAPEQMPDPERAGLYAPHEAR
ncbi:isoprenylcysteine carboxylmethyltransferase family protein [uncultured Roseobacter sp.]|uniref:isoprenylcysteine carboxylmethyltransferase family protein n=1 Tax=uncultured Roseobacter sp. TaxID=114847 RepID=UPI00263A07E1|nr:isoprenylcysteine carboxylmethyltransferase family protein [uncultured Roseobacter sp.]